MSTCKQLYLASGDDCKLWTQLFQTRWDVPAVAWEDGRGRCANAKELCLRYERNLRSFEVSPEASNFQRVFDLIGESTPLRPSLTCATLHSSNALPRTLSVLSGVSKALQETWSVSVDSCEMASSSLAWSVDDVLKFVLSQQVWSACDFLTALAHRDPARFSEELRADAPASLYEAANQVQPPQCAPGLGVRERSSTVIEQAL
ncbi:hypothetical protein CYMTET_33193 [Cymbomonas tetramitiformis]|uniref:Uncharacterized protein n=1 Tax=Cymbomonas tetramitiformis TaxID=36881 RepID=A0AAE0KR67_9CHLO|nr:hypothetical protein CYMTET_33193 [Cymbomonas tetramitiformis]